MTRRDSLLKKSVAAVLGSALLLLSPGLDLYKAFAENIAGVSGVPVKAGGPIAVTPGVAAGGGNTSAASSGNLLNNRGLNGRFNAHAIGAAEAIPSPNPLPMGEGDAQMAPLPTGEDARRAGEGTTDAVPSVQESLGAPVSELRDTLAKPGQSADGSESALRRFFHGTVRPERAFNGVGPSIKEGNSPVLSVARQLSEELSRTSDIAYSRDLLGRMDALVRQNPQHRALHTLVIQSMTADLRRATDFDYSRGLMARLVDLSAKTPFPSLRDGVAAQFIAELSRTKDIDYSLGVVGRLRQLAQIDDRAPFQKAIVDGLVRDLSRASDIDYSLSAAAAITDIAVRSPHRSVKQAAVEGLQADVRRAADIGYSERVLSRIEQITATMGRRAGNGIARQPGEKASLLRKAGAFAVFAAATAAIGYLVYHAGVELGNWLGGIEWNLRHWTPDLGMVGALGLGLKGTEPPAAVEPGDPVESYAAALADAQNKAVAKGFKAGDVQFYKGDVKEGRWDWEFYVPSKRESYGQTYWRVGGEDGTMFNLRNGVTLRTLESYYFGRGVRVSPATARQLAEKEAGTLTPELSLTLVTLPNGDQDLHYNFDKTGTPPYASPEVMVNARTGEVTVRKAPRELGDTRLGVALGILASATLLLGIPVGTALLVAHLTGWTLAASFFAVAGTAFAAIFVGAAFPSQSAEAGGWYTPFAMYMFLISVVDVIAAIVMKGTGNGIAPASPVDEPAALRHVVHALTAKVHERLDARQAPSRMIVGIREAVRELESFFAIPSEDPAQKQAVADVQRLLSKFEIFAAGSAAATGDSAAFIKSLSETLGAMQYAADTSETREEALARLGSVIGADLSRDSGRAGNGVAPQAPAPAPKPKESMSAVEVIGKGIAFALALGPAAIGFYLLSNTAPLLAYAAIAQSLPIALFALAPKTKARSVLSLPGIAALGMAVILAMSGSYVAAAAAAVNAIGMIHYALLSTKPGATNYRDEERGLVSYFTALLNASGFAAFAAFSGWHAALPLAGPALAFFMLAYNKAFDFKLKFFTSWGLGFARGARNAAVSAFDQFGFWWRSATRSSGDRKWTVALGYIPLVAYGAVEGVALAAAAFIMAVPYGVVSGFEKAFEDVAPGSFLHRFFGNVRAIAGGTMALAKGEPGSAILRDAIDIWSLGAVLVPVGAAMIVLARAVQAVQFAGSLLLAVVVPVPVALGLTLFGRSPKPFPDVQPGDRSPTTPLKDPPVAVIGDLLAVGLSAIPAALGYLLTGASPVLGASLLVSSVVLALSAVLAGKDNALARTLPAFAMAGSVLALTVPLSGMHGAALAAAAFGLADLLGVTHLEIVRDGTKDPVDRQAVRAETWFATLAMALVPLAVSHPYAAVPAAAMSTGLLALAGAYKFKGLFWDGLTEGFADGLQETFTAAFERGLWWHDLLSFWKGGSWVKVLGALPIFAFYAVEGVLALAIGLASAFAWAPLRALEKGFESAAKGGLLHGFFSRFNAFLSKSVKAFGDLASARVFGAVKALLATPNFLTVPAGLLVLVLGQVLQLAGSAAGAVWGVVAGLVVGMSGTK